MIDMKLIGEMNGLEHINKLELLSQNEYLETISKANNKRIDSLIYMVEASKSHSRKVSADKDAMKQEMKRKQKKQKRKKMKMELKMLREITMLKTELYDIMTTGKVQPQNIVKISDYFEKRVDRT